MKPLGCILGRHKWQYIPAVYNSATEERLDLPSKPGERQCVLCGEEHIMRNIGARREWKKK